MYVSFSNYYFLYVCFCLKMMLRCERLKLLSFYLVLSSFVLDLGYVYTIPDVSSVNERTCAALICKLESHISDI